MNYALPESILLNRTRRNIAGESTFAFCVTLDIVEPATQDASHISLILIKKNSYDIILRVHVVVGEETESREMPLTLPPASKLGLSCTKTFSNPEAALCYTIIQEKKGVDDAFA
jgi:hypothetical protein